jgi:hypothetical protein
MVSTADFYNATTYGGGIEGILNWGNTWTDGIFANIFLVMIWIVSSYVLSKSEWKMSNVITFTSFLTFLLAVIMSLFMTVNGYIIFFSSVVFVVALVVSIIDRK